MTDLKLDYTNCLAETIGATHGLTPAEIDTLVAKFPKHHEAIEDVRSAGTSAFFELPYQDTSAIDALVKANKGKWDAVVYLGIGGATIAPQSAFRCLAHRYWNELTPRARKNAPRVFFIDNADPRSLSDLQDTLDPKKTLVVLVSRTGVTAETMANTLSFLAWLRKKSTKTALPKQVIVCTDTDSSPLAEIAKADKFQTVHLPDNLGDRFGILGPQALLLLGLCGFDTKALLAGAGDMDQRCRQGDALTNPAYMHSLIHYLLTRKRRKTLHTMMAFSDRLDGAVDWYSHLLSVSLGKMLNQKGKAVHVGPTPATCLGPNGCYGQMQLYAEGPFDKVVTFLTVQDHLAEQVVPKAYPKIDAAQYLAEVPVGKIIDAGYVAAAHALTASGRPNMTVRMERVDEHGLGGLAYMLMLSTVMSAELYGIDAFDQPLVDSNKQAIFAQLGRAGFEDKASALEQFLATPRKTC